MRCVVVTVLFSIILILSACVEQETNSHRCEDEAKVIEFFQKDKEETKNREFSENNYSIERIKCLNEGKGQMQIRGTLSNSNEFVWRRYYQYQHSGGNQAGFTHCFSTEEHPKGLEYCTYEVLN